MVNRTELERAIDAYERSTNFNIDTCVKLASLYTIYNELYTDAQRTKTITVDVIETDKSTEFLQAINGKPVESVVKVMNELMDIIKLINNNGYIGTIKKLNDI